ncbi:hypothetical protein HQ48_02570 [Porphyromonas sp. COT-290 OH3588]|nr:hypothetical protein HQ48_02570 [Porphyromonas sp. COT-290 OH3588]
MGNSTHERAHQARPRIWPLGGSRLHAPSFWHLTPEGRKYPLKQDNHNRLVNNKIKSTSKQFDLKEEQIAAFLPINLLGLADTSLHIFPPILQGLPINFSPKLDFASRDPCSLAQIAAQFLYIL